jgi:hypothetical protein
VGQPWISFDNGTRVVLLAIVTVHIVVFFGSDYTERKKAPKQASSTASGDRATDLGKSAGRVVGSGVNVVRKWRNSDTES